MIQRKMQVQRNVMKLNPIKLNLLFLGVIIFILCLVNIQEVLAKPVPVVGGGSNPSALGGGSNKSSSVQTISYLQNPLEANNVEALLYSIVDLAIFIGVILAVLMFIFIGFKFILAQGKQAKLIEARNWFLYAVIGTAVLISSKVIVEVIKTTFISAGVVKEDAFTKKP